VYPGLFLPPASLEPVLDELAASTQAFGVNFLVPMMDPDSLELAAQRAPYVDFFLAQPTGRSSTRCTPEARCAAGRSRRRATRSLRRRRAPTSSS
jgi:hypothetical protein